MTAMPRIAIRLIAGALALAVTSGSGAGEPARLAATLVVTQGDRVALIDFPGGQAWLRAGESAAGCRLMRVEAAAADLECGERRIRLLLELGPERPAERPVEHIAGAGVDSATLPPGMLSALAARPQAIALAADFSPVVEYGRLTGWRVVRLAEGGALAGFGLREADVVRAVDGAPAAEPAAFAAAIRALPAAHAFTLELSREGQSLTLLVAAPPAP